tara:strand:- start:1236 stop:1541 length:306 start_codon:yes stop_codon:yes gene_type:complete
MYFGYGTQVNPSYTKQDKEIARQSRICQKYKYYIGEAEKAKKWYQKTMESLKKDTLNKENREAGERLAKMEKQSCWEYFNKAQELKQKHPEIITESLKYSL